MHSAATTRPRESTTCVAAAATPLSRSPTDVAQPSARIRSSSSASLAPGALGNVSASRLRAAELEPLGLVVRERQQQLAGGARSQRQRTTQLDERAELVAGLHGGDAHARVLVPQVQVHALPDRIPEPSHRWLGDDAQVERLRGRLAPVQEAGTERVAAILGPPDDAQARQLAEQPVRRRLGHVEGGADERKGHRLASVAETVDQLACLLQDRHAVPLYWFSDCAPGSSTPGRRRHHRSPMAVGSQSVSAGTYVMSASTTTSAGM